MANVGALMYTPFMQKDKTFIYGKHPVKEALNERADLVREIFFEDGNDDEEIRSLAKKNEIKTLAFNTKSMPGGLSRDVVHQGVVAELDVDELIQDFDEFVHNFKITDDTAFVILGEDFCCFDSRTSAGSG
jgi:tRNA G18 (ribose-2'-O)-methylase SpoU